MDFLSENHVIEEIFKLFSSIIVSNSSCNILSKSSPEFKQTSYFKNRSLDLTLSDYPAGNPEYVQTTPVGHIPFGF